MNSVEDAIASAERVLPGTPAPESELDPRWQAILKLQAFVETDPEPLWAFARRWGASTDEDLRTAVATCLLEHLLEHHFTALFPRVAAEARGDPLFADAVLQCWPFGESALHEPQAQLQALKAELDAPAG